MQWKKLIIHILSTLARLILPRTASVAKSANALASVTSGPRSSSPSCRSQALSSLRSDCQALRSDPTSRGIDTLVVHCTDTRPNQRYTLEMLQADHRRRGFGAWPGYHLYIRRDGTIHYCRPLRVAGCHVKGHNSHSVGVCYEGGHSQSPEYKYEDNRTAEQLLSLNEVLTLLKQTFPHATILGHHDLNPSKPCPCFDARHEYAYL